ncbi:hypothetical protein GOV09_03350 [Candidatus Woesearchaeota archaeon]|nr:hypothetical protein [Candidatus Woesearchaeota archaeon]
MPILNLKKKDGKDSVEEVPDELPSLPEEKKEESPADAEELKKEEAQAEEAPAETEEKAEEAPAEETPSEAEPTEELAPDELPPVQEPATEQAEEPQQEVQQPEAQPAQPQVLDERLYFSKLIDRLNKGEAIEEISKEIRDKDIISALRGNLKENQRQDKKGDFEKDIKQMMVQLQVFERDWSTLKVELEDKKSKFEDTEKKIREFTDQIKGRFSDIDHLKHHH